MKPGPITTTSAAGLEPLGSPAQRSYELLSSALKARLGPDFAALLAEPVAAAAGDRIDWYANAPGDIRPLADLPEAEAAALKTRLGAMVAAIRAEADILLQSARPDDQRLGEALANATEIPGPELIFARAGPDGTAQPVLVHWAWLRQEGRAVRGVLTAMIPRPATSAASAPAAPRPWAGWWWLVLCGWALLALMTGAILALLIAPCALMPGRIGTCPEPPPAMAAALTEARAAANEVAGAERLLALARRNCQPTVPLTPAAPPPVPPARPETEETDETRTNPPGEDDRQQAARRLDTRGAARGDLNFVLDWEGTDDVDIYVTCPTGQTVSHRNTGDCNGSLDLDANAKRKTAIPDPMENVVFEDAPLGIYKIRAHLRAHRSGGPVTVRLHVLRRDGPSQSYVGMLRPKERSWTTIVSISR